VQTYGWVVLRFNSEAASFTHGMREVEVSEELEEIFLADSGRRKPVPDKARWQAMAPMLPPYLAAVEAVAAHAGLKLNTTALLVSDAGGGGQEDHSDFNPQNKDESMCTVLIASNMAGTKFMLVPGSHHSPITGPPFTEADKLHLTLPAGCILVRVAGAREEGGGGRFCAHPPCGPPPLSPAVLPRIHGACG
jgi:hypothetical protein